MPDTHQYLCLKRGQAAKTGERSTGYIHYVVLTDPDRQALFLALTANDAGGWFSREIIPLSRIEAVLAALPDRTQAVHSKLLREAFISKSVNNSGFLCAALRTEGLLAPAPDAAHQHIVTDDWDLWKSVMLTESGVPYDPPQPKSVVTANAAIIVKKEEKQPAPAGKRKGPKKTERSIPEAPQVLATETTGEGSEPIEPLASIGS